MPRLGDMTSLQIADRVDAARATEWERLCAESDALLAARDFLTENPGDWVPCGGCELTLTGPGLLFSAEPCDDCLEEVLNYFNE